jgi:DNA (cytosine-5)-methyltransferase 1
MLRIGTDCSGIEAPIQALKNLGIPFSHEFSSDIDKYCIQSIKANYEPKILFGDPDGSFPCGDITKRDIAHVPDIDLYVCGFPCQPFSAAGRKNGFVHKSGNVFWSCLEVIRVKKPKYFILENVKGLLSNDKGKTWKTIWGALNELDDYTVEWKILNTKDYGIPQNRERLFIVGRKGSSTPFSWPTSIPLTKKLSEYVDTTITDRKNYSVTREAYIKKYSSHVFLDLCWVTMDNRRKQQSRLGKEIASCVCATNNIVCLYNGLHRDATCGELLQLQGFLPNFNQAVSKTQITKQIGNSMSVNVLEKIIKSLVE